MGVADGVYMWKELGIDSGTMARTLMETCQHMVAAGCEDVYKGVTADALPIAVAAAQPADTGQLGGQVRAAPDGLAVWQH